MAEFKFSCPQCGQHIQCDAGYSGAQINCPSCQQSIVVPQAPPSAAAPPPAPAPRPVSSGLSTRQSTSAPAAGRQYAGAPGRQPVKAKSNAMRNVLVITAVVLILAALGWGGWFGYSKYKAHKAKVEAAKGNPAAQVPTPSVIQSAGALDILSKTHLAYTNLASLSVEGTSVMVMDMSQVTAADVNPNMTDAQKKAAEKRPARRPAGMPAAITNSTEVSIKLARPDSYLVEGTSKMAAGRTTMTNTTAVWSSGKTNYTLMVMAGGAYKNFTTAPDRKTALMTTAQSGGLAMTIPQMFFDEASDMGKFITDWGQTDDDSVDGQDCYTLTAKMFGQKLKIWVSKASYMILQSQITLGGPVSDADIDAAFDTFNNNTHQTQAQLDQQKKMAKQQAAMMTKIRGTITETYDNIQTNVTFTADDFNYSVPRGVRLTPPVTPPAAATP
jgi:outer membrane lipoprotein-sorting protein